LQEQAQKHSSDAQTKVQDLKKRLETKEDELTKLKVEFDR
jgi:hypothetical protein